MALITKGKQGYALPKLPHASLICLSFEAYWGEVSKQKLNITQYWGGSALDNLVCLEKNRFHREAC